MFKKSTHVPAKLLPICVQNTIKHSGWLKLQNILFGRATAAIRKVRCIIAKYSAFKCLDKIVKVTVLVFLLYFICICVVDILSLEVCKHDHAFNWNEQSKKNMQTRLSSWFHLSHTVPDCSINTTDSLPWPVTVTSPVRLSFTVLRGIQSQMREKWRAVLTCC